MHSYCGAAISACAATMSADVVCCFLAGRQGGRALQGHEFVEFPAAATLRCLGRSLLPDGELLSVEACKSVSRGPWHVCGSAVAH